jgi:alpha-beta hydrolase superfamily lysophospholipase
MTYKTSKIKVSDGLNIHLHHWSPENPTKLMLLVHGAVEHAKRYDAFARALNEQGFVVIAPDHRGHGLTAIESGVFSHFGDDDGFLRSIQDLEEILNHIKTEYPNLPRAIFGHSLGSFMTRKLISLRGDEFQAAIISATSWGNTFELKGGLFLTSVWSQFTDKNKPNQTFNDFLWGTLNAKVKDRKGTLDFISRDEKEVEKYEQDPLNGNTITIEFGEQMSKAILMVREDEVFNNTPNNLNIYLASGTGDPLSNKGKDIEKIAKKYTDSGKKNVTLKLYSDARHEILNEINKEEVMTDMIDWLNDKIKI